MSIHDAIKATGDRVEARHWSEKNADIPTAEMQADVERTAAEIRAMQSAVYALDDCRRLDCGPGQVRTLIMSLESGITERQEFNDKLCAIIDYRAKLEREAQL